MVLGKEHHTDRACVAHGGAQHGLNARRMRIQCPARNQQCLNAPGMRIQRGLVDHAEEQAAHGVWTRSSWTMQPRMRHELGGWQAMCDVCAGFDAIRGTNSGDGRPCATFVPDLAWSGGPLSGWACPMCLDSVGVGADPRRIATLPHDSAEVAENETGIATWCLDSLVVAGHLWRIETHGTSYRLFSSPSSS